MMTKDSLKKAYRLFLAIFLILMSIDVISLGLVPYVNLSLLDLSLVHYFVKPFLMPVLGIMAVFLYKLRGVSKTITVMVILALAFHTAGDVFLLYDDYFIPGLLSFLIGHIFYLIVLKTNIWHYSMHKRGLSVLRTLLYFIVVLPLPLFMVHFYNLTSPMSIYVGIYGIVLVSVLYLAVRLYFLRVECVTTLILGAIIFVISDLLLSANIFMGPYFKSIFRLSPAIVMLTYCIGDLLIVTGISKLYKPSYYASNCRFR